MFFNIIWYVLLSSIRPCGVLRGYTAPSFIELDASRNCVDLRGYISERNPSSGHLLLKLESLARRNV